MSPTETAESLPGRCGEGSTSLICRTSPQCSARREDAKYLDICGDEEIPSRRHAGPPGQRLSPTPYHLTIFGKCSFTSACHQVPASRSHLNRLYSPDKEHVNDKTSYETLTAVILLASLESFCEIELATSIFCRRLCLQSMITVGSKGLGIQLQQMHCKICFFCHCGQIYAIGNAQGRRTTTQFQLDRRQELIEAYGRSRASPGATTY